MKSQNMKTTRSTSAASIGAATTDSWETKKLHLKLLKKYGRLIVRGIAPDAPAALVELVGRSTEKATTKRKRDELSDIARRIAANERVIVQGRKGRQKRQLLYTPIPAELARDVEMALARVMQIGANDGKSDYGDSPIAKFARAALDGTKVTPVNKQAALALRPPKE